MPISTEEQNPALNPGFFFEVSWEICNKVGGIHTVITSKYPSLVSRMSHPDQIIMIGPDVWKETSQHPEFEEDPFLMKQWRDGAARDGLFFRVGRWKMEGNPLTILVDFTTFFPKKDHIFTRFWETSKLDSISGQWDYIEPALFGYAAGKVIESYYRNNLSPQDHVVAQFHEWMTGTGVLYLKEYTPGIAVAFTTHATVIGRSLAGNGRPLYKLPENFNPDVLASEFTIKAKYSLEKRAAEKCDVFTTVSELTARECRLFLGRNPDFITPNGFVASSVPSPDHVSKLRSMARPGVLKVLSALLSVSFDDDTFLILTSGRYEFRNKGLDLFIRSIAGVDREYQGNKKIVALMAVPGAHQGPRRDLIEKLEDNHTSLQVSKSPVTHLLQNPSSDPILDTLKMYQLSNHPEGNVFVCFVPVYLNGSDGIFNVDYYTFLSAFDLTLFPSYYEPWGYTPLESIAYGIPTATTSLSGFGQWIKESMLYNGNAVKVMERSESNEETVVQELTTYIMEMAHSEKAVLDLMAEEARKLSEGAGWDLFIQHYFDGYIHALNLSLVRMTEEPYHFSNGRKLEVKPVPSQPEWNKVLVKASYPDDLLILREMAGNLWWSWNTRALELFAGINPEYWAQSGNNPVKLLSMLSYSELQDLTTDEKFLDKMNAVATEYHAYLSSPGLQDAPAVAYFSMEYGLHECLKIYSGGLGVLAGDYLKEASDSGYPVTAIGFLYRNGYFSQSITPWGDQVVGYFPQKFSELPIHPVRDEQGDWVKISVAFPGRNVYAKVWEVKVGKVSLFLMDTDIEENNQHDRVITHQLYGGDQENRLKQELLLGVGGIRLIHKLNLHPEVYHCNEGHAAFIGFERLRDLVQDKLLAFDEALEVVRSSTLFTTHTPVPAGHDRFPEELLRAYISHYPDRLHISWEDLMSLGREQVPGKTPQFSMSVLAIKTSQEVNGVSKLHGEVSRKMFNYLYPGYFSHEMHIGHVTNGVHYHTWTHPLWQKVHASFLPQPVVDHQHLENAWEKIDQISDDVLWITRSELQNHLMVQLRIRLEADMTRRQDPPGHIVKVLESLQKPMLTIGFARRFATYKRAHLLFSNEERLKKILNGRKFPVRFLFAGKAHPNDKAGQDLIKKIIHFSHKPGFEGKIIFIENYDMELGRLLTSGCDIWLNTPTRPMEASGTSGEKAVMNGVLNLSVLDGWWAEGFKPEAGWALPESKSYQNQEMQDQLDAETIYNLIEDTIIPLYYTRNQDGIPVDWIRFVRNNFQYITPHFTMRRMLNDYHQQYYTPLGERGKSMMMDEAKNARILSSWKRRVLAHWDNIVVETKQTYNSTTAPLKVGDDFSATVILYAPGLSAEDLGLEVLFGAKINNVVDEILFSEPFQVFNEGGGRIKFVCRMPVNRSGVFDYTFRLFPTHPLLVHRMDFPLVKWI